MYVYIYIYIYILVYSMSHVESIFLDVIQDSREVFSRIKLCKLYRHFLNKINYNQRQIQLKNWRKLYIILSPSKIYFSIFSSNFYSCTYMLSKQLTFSTKLEDNCFTMLCRFCCTEREGAVSRHAPLTPRPLSPSRHHRAPS